MYFEFKGGFTGGSTGWAAVVAAATMMLATPAIAESPIPGTFAANVALGTDYVFRGISQTDEEPTVQGGFDWSHDSGIYLGIWGSNVDRSEEHTSELQSLMRISYAVFCLKKT